MKSTFLTVLAAGLFVAVGTLQADDLSGKISGVKSNAVIVYRVDLSHGKAMPLDTISLKDGAFSMSLPQIFQQVYVLPKPADQTEAMPMIRPSDGFFYLPGDQLKLNGPADRMVPSGTPLYDGLAAISQYPSLKALKYQTDSLMAVINQAYQDKEKNKAVIDQKAQELRVLLGRQKSLCKEVVMSQPNSVVSAYLVSRLPAKDQVELMALLSPETRNGAFKPLFDRTKESLELHQKREEARKTLAPGAPAPEFSLREVTGKQRTLADFRGKYVLLDFWGTWCGWCIKGIPKMKEYYAKYKDRMEIVGICCNDTEDAWRHGVARHALPWTNLYNGYAKEVVTRYAVTGFPTKVLIDPDGNLVQIFVGESDEMYQKLDELFTN